MRRVAAQHFAAGRPSGPLRVLSHRPLPRPVLHAAVQLQPALRTALQAAVLVSERPGQEWFCLLQSDALWVPLQSVTSGRWQASDLLLLQVSC